jgi:DNA-binding MarR family transcriptional regulator/GNAT superfamily N-acetyltransferase
VDSTGERFSARCWTESSILADVVDVVPRVRAFNRDWTQVVGLLDRGLLHTRHSLPEARVLFELAQRDGWERSELRQRLGIDDSFLSRLIAGLARDGLVLLERSPTDGRRRQVRLTSAGRAAFRRLDRRSTAQVEELARPLTDGQRRQLVEAMSTIRGLVRAGDTDGAPDVVLRGPRPGDIGWVVQRHGEIYWDEYGWDQSFESLVAGIVADFAAAAATDEPGGVASLPTSAWIAEIDGARAGCVFCCARDEHTAQLRLLLVEPWARGSGLGRRLVDECLDFARRAGYAEIVLWTNDVLVAARRIYEAAGFELVDEQPHHSFGHDLVGQTWRLELEPAVPGGESRRGQASTGRASVRQTTSRSGR